MRKTLGASLILLAVLPGSTGERFGAAVPGPRAARTLSFEERVAAQRVIEEVYWRHRIWPKENPQPKPSLDAVMPESAIRAKVEDYLKKSSALEMWWQRPITNEQLQAELDRMVKQTHDPGTLRELFAALRGDPLLIAETLARQMLTDRLIRNWYAYDSRVHGDTKRRAEEDLAVTDAIAVMKAMRGTYSEVTWRRKTAGNVGSSIVAGTEHVLDLASGEWDEQVERIARTFGVSKDAIPTDRLGKLQETAIDFHVTVVLDASGASMKLATVTWPKAPFDVWWGQQAIAVSHAAAVVGSKPFFLPATQVVGCTDDTWEPTHIDVPDQRSGHKAVWTGTEMIIWGGSLDYPVNTGGRYTPSTDSWQPTSVGPNTAPAGNGNTAVWTGTEMIVWGGSNGGGDWNTGGRYNPATDGWLATSTANVPTARGKHTAVWTGTEMIVWGGQNGFHPLDTGGRYNPATNSWLATSTANVPTARGNHTAAWTGTEMIVWGGYYQDGSVHSLNTGGRYSPSTNSWAPTSTVSVPSARHSHAMVWTGTEVIVWGGIDQQSDLVNTGGRYNPATDTWVFTSTGVNVPSARYSHTMVWTGTEMIVWGGAEQFSALANTGGRYNPATNSWVSTSTGANVPSARFGHTALWTGTEMIVWGGYHYELHHLNTGGRYSPSADSWVPTSTGANVPSRRYQHTAVWTGAEMIVWGGYYRFDGVSQKLNTGARYNPSADDWEQTSTGANVPLPRGVHVAVWTGTEMIVWGGGDNIQNQYVNSGGRYNPSTDSWVPTSTGPNVPTERYSPSVVWTGTEMIVWGGNYGNSHHTLGTGGRYNPSTDGWAPTSTGPNAPSARGDHTVVWTGTEMIVWGGDGPFNSGGRYNPSTDSWVPTSTGPNVPTARYSHAAVWTGTEMIVWGGTGGGLSNTGGRYNPLTDGWVPTSMGPNVPTARYKHTMLWTGTEMIVWGGTVQDAVLANTGGRYDPWTDSWATTSIGKNVPFGRAYYTAVWTGTEMIVWGGAYNWALLDGARYCACLVSTTSYRDADGDGDGDPARSTITCDGTIPDGYVADAADCNDADPSTHPGADDVCNSVDDDCNGLVDDGLGQTICGIGACQRTVDNCSNGAPQACVPGQPSPEACNGIDDDCNGLVDDGLARKMGAHIWQVCDPRLRRFEVLDRGTAGERDQTLPSPFPP